MPTEDEIRSRLPADKRYPYDFGFLAAMTRLADGFGLAVDPLTQEASETGIPLKHPG